MPKEDIFYVTVRDSAYLHRQILETSKDIIECLHRFERFKKIRAEKIKAVEELIVLFRDINDLTAKMKIEMPKVKLPPLPKKKAEEKKEEKKEHPGETDDELKKLEAAIAQIEARLNEIK